MPIPFSVVPTPPTASSLAHGLIETNFPLAGADITVLKDLTLVTAYMSDFLRPFAERIQAIRKPIIAAVNGFAVCMERRNHSGSD